MVYFNAWENDFLDDPLLSLVSVIRDQLSEHQGTQSLVKGKIKELTKKTGELAVAIAPSIMKAAAKKYLGDDFLEVLDGEASAESAEKFVQNILEKNKEALTTVEEFKASLEQLFKAAGSRSDDKPIYIFIDELDRCRPTYAIKLLERVKHFFAIDGCRFVIATDTDQLAHAICAVYGSGFSSRRYLKRFFDSTFKLDNTQLDNWIITHIKDENYPPFDNYFIYSKYPTDKYTSFNKNSVDPIENTLFSSNLTPHQLIFKALTIAFKSQIRDLEAITKRLNSFKSHYLKSEWDYFFCTYLVFLVDSEIEFNHPYTHYDNKEFWADVEIKYPATNTLHVGIANITVHRMAQIYFKALCANRQKGIDMANSNNVEASIATLVISKKSIYIQCINIARLSAQLS